MLKGRISDSETNEQLAEKQKQATAATTTKIAQMKFLLVEFCFKRERERERDARPFP